MDPVTAVVTALALGASEGFKDTAKEGIKEAYAGLKTLIQSRCHRVDLAQLEVSPKSKARQAVLKEDLESNDVVQDPEILERAGSLLDLINHSVPDAASAIGIDLEDIQAASLQIADVIASGTGVKIRGTKIAEKMEIIGVRAGVSESNQKKN